MLMVWNGQTVFSLFVTDLKGKSSVAVCEFASCGGLSPENLPRTHS